MTDIPDSVLARAIEAAEPYETLEFQIKAAARVIAERVRAEERAASDAAIDAAHEETFAAEDSLEELTKENEQLRAEVERLKACQLDLVKRLPPLSADPVVGQAFSAMLDAITLDVERSRAAQEERAAIAAFVCKLAPDSSQLADIAAVIESGDFRRL